MGENDKTRTAGSEPSKIPKHEHHQDMSILSIQKDVNFIRGSITKIENSIGELKENIDDKFVSMVEFIPVKRVVYGLVGFALLYLVADKFILP